MQVASLVVQPYTPKESGKCVLRWQTDEFEHQGSWQRHGIKPTEKLQARSRNTNSALLKTNKWWRAHGLWSFTARAREISNHHCWLGTGVMSYRRCVTEGSAEEWVPTDIAVEVIFFPWRAGSRPNQWSETPDNWPHRHGERTKCSSFLAVQAVSPRPRCYKRIAGPITCKTTTQLICTRTSTPSSPFRL